MRPVSFRPLIAGVGLGLCAAIAKPAPADFPTIDIGARNAIVVDFNTGAVLLDKGADQRIPPASMSKMMTTYVVFKYLKEGRIKLDDMLPVSEAAWHTGGSKMFVPLGGRVSVQDLIRGMVIQSGNDACVVLAEGIAGSQAAFVDQMNAMAKTLGLTGSHYADVNGLPDPGEYTTVRDLATLARHLITDFPQYYFYFAEKDFTFNGIKQGNRNPLLYKVAGADGLKTGHTDESGYSLIGAVLRGDRRVIVVVSGLASMKDRASEGERLVEWAFREYSNYKLLSAGDKVDDADVWLGTEPKVGMTIASDLVVTLPRSARRDMKVTVSYDKPVPAPVNQGDAIGKVVVTAPDIAPIERPLYAAASVPQIGTLGRMATVAAYLIWGNRR